MRAPVGTAVPIPPYPEERLVDFLLYFVDVMLHLDKHVGEIIQWSGIWIYVILFLVIFLETGLVVTPFLPGDSLLFVVGTFAALGKIDVGFVWILLLVAAIIGDTVNYHMGKYVGPKVFHSENVRFLNKKHLMKAHDFYERHGGKTIIIARFVPIIRTFAPFVAGIGRMSYPRFLIYNVTGALAWITIFIFGGYYFGNIPAVKRNFTLVIVMIILLSIAPAVIAAISEKRKGASQGQV